MINSIPVETIPVRLASAPLVVQKAFEAMPSYFHPGNGVRLLKYGAGGNIVCKFEIQRNVYVLKLFNKSDNPSPLLPCAADCALKEARLAALPNLRKFIPLIHCIGVIEHEGEMLSFFVQDFSTGNTAATSIRTLADVKAFATELGSFSRQLHGIRVTGYGSVFLSRPDEHVAFAADSWMKYVQQRIDLCGIHALEENSNRLRGIVNEVSNALIGPSAAVLPTLFHHDLLHNWSNVLVHRDTHHIANVIDWDQCGAGDALTMELGVARFALRGRRDEAFEWSTFLQYFLAGYGIELAEYRCSLRRQVNAFSTLYAARSAHLFVGRRHQFESYILEALGNELH